MKLHDDYINKESKCNGAQHPLQSLSTCITFAFNKTLFLKHFLLNKTTLFLKDLLLNKAVFRDV